MILGTWAKSRKHASHPPIEEAAPQLAVRPSVAAFLIEMADWQTDIVTIDICFDSWNILEPAFILRFSTAANAA